MHKTSSQPESKREPNPMPSIGSPRRDAQLDEYSNRNAAWHLEMPCFILYPKIIVRSLPNIGMNHDHIRYLGIKQDGVSFLSLADHGGAKAQKVVLA